MGLLRCLDLSPSRTEYQRVIRVAFVIPTLDQSGAERQLTMLASALPKDEYEVQVIALNRGGPYADQLLASGIKVEVLGKRFRFDPLTYMRLRTALHRFQPQIIQSFLFRREFVRANAGNGSRRQSSRRVRTLRRFMEEWVATRARSTFGGANRRDDGELGKRRGVL